MGWYERLGRWVDDHRFGTDVAIAAMLLLICETTVVDSNWLRGDGYWSLASFDAQVRIWSILVVAPLAWRRIYPVASAVAVYTAAFAQLLAVGDVLFPADLAVLVALFTVTVYGPAQVHWAALGASLAGAAALGATYLFSFDGPLDNTRITLIVTIFAAVVFTAVWAFGLLRRSQRELLANLRGRAESFEVERAQQAQLGAAAERTRIARDMHDIVAHSLSVIIAQADGGRYASASDPQAANRALTTVAETGRAALADMRRLLGVLREDDPDQSIELAPRPGGTEIDELIEQTKGSGVRISTVRVGQPRPLPPGVGITAYRACQEALTNVLKHAGPDPSVTVTIQWAATSLDIEVADDGRGAAAEPGPEGYGLVGMRERAELFGGAVTAGPRPGGGFRVHIHLPTPTQATSPTEGTP